MEVKNRKILEALQMQPLSEEEMTARHILGRLYGPIASCVESTRNTRLYNRELWEKALQDEIFLEKVATKALFLELGHPTDREETDMKQTCACIPEVPKIVGYSEEEATRMLEELGLKMEVTGRVVSSEYVIEGFVTYQSYTEGYRLKQGDTVEVTVMGKISIYLASKPFYYSSHMEILLSYKERA